MPRPFLIAQLTDLHIGAKWGQGDPTAGLDAAVRAIAALPDPVDVLLISGDLVENGLDAEYEQVLELVGRLDLPVYALPGNHDHRDRLRRHFSADGEAGTPVQYAVDLGPMRLVALDTTRPGEDSGELDSDRLAWLEDELARSPTKPTVVAMHHPPFATGLPGFDRIDLPPSQRRALAEAVARHPQVLAFVAGHIHRATTGVVAGRPAITAPSTYLHSRALFDSDRLEFVAATPGFAIHALVDGGLASHIESAEPPR